PRRVELPDARRAARAPRPGGVLARAPLAPREHQQDQGDRPLVQSELYPPDEGREVDGNPREPNADAPAQGVPETLNVPPEPLPLAESWSSADPLPLAEPLPLAGEPMAEAPFSDLPITPDTPVVPIRPDRM